MREIDIIMEDTVININILVINDID